MITLQFTQSVYKEYLDGKAPNNYMEYMYRRVAQEFADELAKHIEPYDITEVKGIPDMVILHFKITGGSLPEHEDESNT